jgi:hypothetical protein
MMASLNNRNATGKALWLLAALLFVPAAQANTYLFSFTASQALAALQTSVGTAIQNESGYYNIFVQPDSLQISSYTYISETTPNPGAKAWDANTITDPSSPNLGFDPFDPCTGNCTFAHWGKGYTQASVMIMSNANGTGAIFQNAQYSDSGVAPYGWGPTLATIDPTIMPGTDTFQFVIQTAQNLSGSYHLVGYASALVSGSNTGFSPPIKDSLGIPFDLNVTVQLSVPEPAAFGPVLAAMAILFWIRRKRRSATNFESAPREVK